MNQLTTHRLNDRRRVSLKSQIEMVICQFFGLLAAIGIGVILMSTFLYTDTEFWANVESFWGTK